MSEASFNHAVRHVLEREGGYVNHKADPGGATNFGVSLRFLLSVEPDLINYGLDFDFDNDGDIDADDIKAMTEQDAREVYFRFFWQRYGYKRIYDLDIATKVFDMCVNMGSKQAHKLVQRACRADGQVLVDDGVMGPNSFKAVNACQPLILLGAIRTEQKHFYLGLIDKKPAFAEFREGWIRRAYC